MEKGIKNIFWYVHPYFHIDQFETLGNMIRAHHETPDSMILLLLDGTESKTGLIEQMLKGTQYGALTNEETTIYPSQILDAQHFVGASFDAVDHYIGGNNFPACMSTLADRLLHSYKRIHPSFERAVADPRKVVAVREWMNSDSSIEDGLYLSSRKIVPVMHFQETYSKAA